MNQQTLRLKSCLNPVLMAGRSVVGKNEKINHHPPSLKFVSWSTSTQPNVHSGRMWESNHDEIVKLSHQKTASYEAASLGNGNAKSPKPDNPLYNNTSTSNLSRERRAGDLHSIPARAGTLRLSGLAPASGVYPPPVIAYQDIKAFSTVSTKKPLVSVIMPVYNGDQFLVEAIESILNQTYKNLELIVVNDASTDNSLLIAEKYQRKHPQRLRVFTTSKQTNSAGNGAMNYGFTKSRGELIARMDADDIAHPSRIEKQVIYMQNYPETIVLGTQAIVIDKYGKVVGKKNMPTTHAEIYRQYGIFHPMIHPSVMIRKSLLPRQDRIYEMRFNVNDDYYTFFKFLNYGQFANLPEYLLKYRMHGKNMSLSQPKAKFIDSIKIRIVAIRHLQYVLSMKALLCMIGQVMVVLPIPERLIVPLYMLVRGIRPTKVGFKLPSLSNFRKYATLSR